MQYDGKSWFIVITCVITASDDDDGFTMNWIQGMKETKVGL